MTSYSRQRGRSCRAAGGRSNCDVDGVRVSTQRVATKKHGREGETRDLQRADYKGSEPEREVRRAPEHLERAEAIAVYNFYEDDCKAEIEAALAERDQAGFDLHLEATCFCMLQDRHLFVCGGRRRERYAIMNNCGVQELSVEEDGCVSSALTSQCEIGRDSVGDTNNPFGTRAFGSILVIVKRTDLVQ